QRGQSINNHSLTDAVNLIPHTAEVPAGALLIDGEYHQPQDVSGGFTRLDVNTMLGEFRYSLPGLDVERYVILSAVSETAEHYLRLTPVAAAGADAEVGDDAAAGPVPALVQFVVPGIGNVTNPVVKIGFDSTFVTNPTERAYQAP